MGTRFTRSLGTVYAALLLCLIVGGGILGGGILGGGIQSARAGPGGYHEDERLGFKIRYPKGWNHVAMGADEAWIATSTSPTRRTSTPTRRSATPTSTSRS